MKKKNGFKKREREKSREKDLPPRKRGERRREESRTHPGDTGMGLHL